MTAGYSINFDGDTDKTMDKLQERIDYLDHILANYRPMVMNHADSEALRNDLETLKAMLIEEARMTTSSLQKNDILPKIYRKGTH